MTAVFVKDPQRSRHIDRRGEGNVTPGGGDWSDATRSPRMPRLGEARKGPSLEL